MDEDHKSNRIILLTIRITIIYFLKIEKSVLNVFIIKSFSNQLNISTVYHPKSHIFIIISINPKYISTFFLLINLFDGNPIVFLKRYTVII